MITEILYNVIIDVRNWVEAYQSLNIRFTLFSIRPEWKSKEKTQTKIDRVMPNDLVPAATTPIKNIVSL